MSTARRVVAVVAIAAVSVLPTLLASSPARAATSAPTARIRVAHLSPDTAEVDAYLQPDGGKARVQGGLGYGAVAGYEQVPPGHWTVVVRAKGSPATGSAMLTSGVDVSAGHAYTVALSGRHAAMSLRLVEDDLTEPATGTARVRVMQASDRGGPLTVSTARTTVASGLGFPAVSGYQAVEAGRFSTKVTGGRKDTSASLRYGTGRVYSLLVLDGPDDGLVVRLHLDAPTDNAPLLSLPHLGSGAPKVSTPSVDTKGLGPAMLAALAAIAIGLGGPRVLAWVRKRKK